jgi:DnaJ-domain-containing protein 1
VGQFELRLIEKFEVFSARFSGLENIVGERHDHIQQNFKELEKLMAERHGSMASDQSDQEKELAQLQAQFVDCRQRCATTFVTTQEFYENLGPVQAKLEKLTEYVLSQR